MRGVLRCWVVYVWLIVGYMSGTDAGFVYNRAYPKSSGQATTPDPLQSAAVAPDVITDPLYSTVQRQSSDVQSVAIDSQLPSPSQRHTQHYTQQQQQRHRPVNHHVFENSKQQMNQKYPQQLSSMPDSIPLYAPVEGPVVQGSVPVSKANRFKRYQQAPRVPLQDSTQAQYRSENREVAAGGFYNQRNVIPRYAPTAAGQHPHPPTHTQPKGHTQTAVRSDPSPGNFFTNSPYWGPQPSGRSHGIPQQPSPRNTNVQQPYLMASPIYPPTARHSGTAHPYQTLFPAGAGSFGPITPFGRVAGSFPSGIGPHRHPGGLAPECGPVDQPGVCCSSPTTCPNRHQIDDEMGVCPWKTVSPTAVCCKPYVCKGRRAGAKSP